MIVMGFTSAVILAVVGWWWWVNAIPKIRPVSTAWLEEHSYDKRQQRQD